jgi:hypothetical protein
MTGKKKALALAGSSNIQRHCYGKMNTRTSVKTLFRLKPVTSIWGVVGFIL